MTPILITGNGQSPQQTLQALAALGLPEALALPRDKNLNLHVWHDKVLAQSTLRPGRVFEQLAAELLLANIGQAVWAWAESKAMALLDFWLGLDPSIRFVLLVETPAQALFRAAQTEPKNVRSVLLQWQSVHRQMLYCAMSHPDRCLLVWANQAQKHPADLAQKLVQQWELNWQPTITEPRTADPDCPLADHLAQHLCQSYPEVQQLAQELASCVTPLHMGATPTPTSPHEPLQLLQQYLALKQVSQKTDEINTLQTELRKLQVELENKDKSLEETQQRLKTIQSNTADKEIKICDLQINLDKALHERHQLNTHVAELQKNLSQAKEQAQQNSQLKKDLQTQSDKCRKLEQARTEAQQEADTLLAQLHETQEEMESWCNENEHLRQLGTELAKLQQRWCQLFETHRDLFAVETLRIEPDTGARNQYKVQLGQLSIAGRHFDSLELGLGIDPSGCASLTFQRSEEDPPPLLRWPRDTPLGGSLVLQPGTSQDTPPERIASFMQLSTSDWQLCQTLPLLLLAVLKKQLATIGLPEQLELQSSLNKYLAESKALQQILRFDRAYLLAPATANTISLQLDLPSFGGQQAPALAITLQHAEQNTREGMVQLHIAPNELLSNKDNLTLQLGPKGWMGQQTLALAESQLKTLQALIASLMLILVDAVEQGADKEQLKPWAETARHMRARSLQIDWTPPNAKSSPIKRASRRKAPVTTPDTPTTRRKSRT